MFSITMNLTNRPQNITYNETTTCMCEGLSEKNSDICFHFGKDDDDLVFYVPFLSHIKTMKG